MEILDQTIVTKIGAIVLVRVILRTGNTVTQGTAMITTVVIIPATIVTIIENTMSIETTEIIDFLGNADTNECMVK